MSHVAVHHPRVPVAPGYLLHSLDATLALPFVQQVVDGLHRRQPFDLIHAHFIYPDGVIAARLGKRYGIPVMTTEHAPWLPWLSDYPSVRRQVDASLPHIRLVTAVSEWLRGQVASVARDQTETAVLPNVVDDEVFLPPRAGEPCDPNQILFVGVVRHVKGLDILVRALALLRHNFPDLRLRVVGNPYYRAYRRDEQAVRRLITELGIENRVFFDGQATPEETARAMRESGLLVLPSRRETFGVVALEALASGTPVVVTRCGGPEEFITPDVGELAPVNDPAGLASSIAYALASRTRKDPRYLRQYAVTRYGREAIGGRIADLYERVLPSAPLSAMIEK